MKYQKYKVFTNNAYSFTGLLKACRKYADAHKGHIIIIPV